ncbi:MAG: putative peptide zinc metalloprotease protein [Actinomycetota bacterium]|nr:putative peptide zinc metalloprotease protein [Actinomycetota bacterium]
MTQQMDETVRIARAPGRHGDRKPARERPPRRGDGRETDASVPQLASGVELIGEYEASGYKEAPCLVRRADGQTIQLTPLLYATLEQIDGQRDVSQISTALGERLDRPVSADNVRYLVHEKLRPAGVVKDRDGRDPEVQKANPLLALRLRLQITGEQATNRLTAPFAILFRPWVVVPVVAGFVAVVAWVIGSRGVGAGARQLLYSPGLMLLTFALTILSASFHEFGHAAACRYSGGRPGAMGCGLYLVWPAFYTDVTDAYRLDRRGRLRTDLGGLYFNAIFALATFGVWALTGVEALLLLIPLQVLQMVHQLLPFIRMDGYHILSDLVGVPDLFARIKPTLLGFVPGRRHQEKAAVLKPWVRVVVALWVLTVVPLLLFSLLTVVISAPRMVATAWDSIGLQWRVVRIAFDTHKWLTVLVGGLGVIALALPVLGSGYAVGRFGRRAGSWGWSQAGEIRFGRPMMALLTVGLAGALAFTWWPNGEYRPIQPGERGTVTDAVAAVSDVGTGRPGLTPETEAELDGAPSQAWNLSQGPTEEAPPPEEVVDDPLTPAGDQSPTPTTTIAGSGDDEPSSNSVPPTTTAG